MTFLPDIAVRLADAAAQRGVPGAAIAVQHGDEYAEAAVGVLNVDTGVETTADSLFQIGSIAKMFTALLVLQLADDQLVELDQPMRRYLPRFRVVDEIASEAVTIRHLLTHTAGFDGDLFDDTGRGDDCLDKYLDLLAVKARQIAPPGRLFSYCNSGYSVLGALIAHMRGGTWEDNVRSRILEPLNLTSAALFAEEAIVSRVSAGHVTVTSTGRATRQSPWELPRSGAPAGGICATPADLVRFGRTFVNGGAGIVRPESVAAMLTRQTAAPAFHSLKGWGLGMKIFNWSGAQIYGHNGNTMGQNAYLRIAPDHDLVVAMVDNNVSGTLGMQDLLIDLLTELTGAIPPKLPSAPSTPDIVDTAPIVGDYENPQASYRVVATRNGIDITRTPSQDDRSIGSPHWTAHFVHYRDNIFVRTEPVPGSFATATFLDNGSYLHNGRASRRVPGTAVT